MGLIVGIAQFVHQNLHDLSHQLIRKITVGSGSLGYGVHGLDSGIHIVRQGLLLLFFCDVALFKHILENHLPLFLVFFLSGNRVQLGGILGDARDHRTLRQSQVSDLLVKISSRSHFYPEAVLAQVDGIEIVG